MEVSVSFKILTLVIVLALTGCASTQLPDYTGQDAGTIVLTSIVGKGSQRDGTYHIAIRDAANHKAYKTFSYSSGNIFSGKEPDFSNTEGIGFVHITSLKPGKYEVYKWSAVGNNWNIKSEEYSISQFDIEAGKSTYVGAFVFKPSIGKNLFGMRIVAGYDLMPSPNAERDIN